MPSPITARWQAIDAWWDTHTASQSQDFEQLNALIERLHSHWADNDAIFTQDPLGDNWESRSPMAGPLRTNQEENWSQWLAHLLRASDGGFPSELFDLPEHQSAVSVSREVHMASDEHHDRRVDLIAEFPDLSCSIELKIDDEQYRKTPEAAYLAEATADHDKPWNHYLLVPNRKQPAVMETFDSAIDFAEDSNPTIRSEGFVDVDLLWWSDVAKTLRRTTPKTDNQVWQASAFLFTMLIEQKALKFRSQPAIEQITSGTTVPDIASTRGVDLDAQIAHLTACVEGESHD